MSLTTTCGASSSSAASASRAEANVLNAMFSRVSAFSNTHRIERSSSMIQTGFTAAPLCARHLRCLQNRRSSSSLRFVLFPDRQQDREKRIAGTAFERDGAVVLRYEILCEREPQSGAAFAAGHERIEDALADRLGNARAVVADTDVD